MDVHGSTIGKKLPRKFTYHCAAQMNDTHAILTGGYPSKPRRIHPESSTLIVRLDDFQMTEGPSMQFPRASHTCGRFQHPNGTNYVIVVGGMKGYIYDDHIHTVDIYFDFQTTTEILNVGSNEGWFKGM